jgi:aminoglycoside 3-N-acetyltransferase
MWKTGVYRGFRPNDGPGLRTVLAKDMFNFVQDIIDSGNALGTLYSIKG